MPSGGGNRGKGKAYAWLREHVNHVGQNCLKWPFAFNKFTGYATFGMEGKIRYAHRWMCEQKNGPPPSPKSEAAHTCGNAHMQCVNPNHLVWKTRKGNAQDRVKHGNHRDHLGKRHFRLTPVQVDEIRSLKGIESQYKLAERFGISRCTISSIHCGRMYASPKQTALDADQVKAIASVKWSYPAKDLASEHGVTVGTIYRIWHGQSHLAYLDQQIKETP